MTEWTVLTLKEHFESLRKEDADALKLQAKEYERRLDNLNGEHATLAQMKDTYVPREVYDHDMDRARTEALAATAAAKLAKDAVDLASASNRRGVIVAVSIALVGWAISGLFLYLGHR